MLETVPHQISRNHHEVRPITTFLRLHAESTFPLPRKAFSSKRWLREASYWNLSGMICLAGVLKKYTCEPAEIQFILEHSAVSTQPSATKSCAKKHMFPEGTFVKMYYFAIEAGDGVGYTLAALRCAKNCSLKISS
jgi:hypothetical protein